MVKSYVSLDLETTGLNPRKDKIIEIGAVKVDNGVPTAEFAAFINPGRKLDTRIRELTGITDEDLLKAPIISQIIPELLDFLGDLPLVGHRILFDYSFLKKAAVDMRIYFEKKGIDTLKIAGKYLDIPEGRGLSALCTYYGIELTAHRALNDARAAGKLYQALLQDYYQEEEPLFLPNQLEFRVKRDTPATKSQKERLYWLINQHKLIVDYDVERLTRSEASRYSDRILSIYGK